ncbi:MAG TPA: hypothetical protein VGA56_22925, partial [Opitutaceae bacterium]
MDILIVYTPAARTYAGSTAAMRASLNSFVALTNLAYRQSGASPVLKLVGSAEISYTESGSLSTDLSRLTNPSDGYMDNAHTLRASHNADLVCLIRRDGAGGASGVAYFSNPSISYQGVA